MNSDNRLPLPLHHPMGSSASKAARKLPKCVEPPKWAGKRTPDSSTGTIGEQVDGILASEHRSKGALVNFSFIVPNKNPGLCTSTQSLREMPKIHISWLTYDSWDLSM